MAQTREASRCCALFFGVCILFYFLITVMEESIILGFSMMGIGLMFFLFHFKRKELLSSYLSSTGVSLLAIGFMESFGRMIIHNILAR
jgi:hypothetical protein